MEREREIRDRLGDGSRRVGVGTRAALEDARRRDPGAPLFQAQNLERLVSKALATNPFAGDVL